MDSGAIIKHDEVVSFGTGPFVFTIDNPLMFGEVFHI